MKDNHGFFHTNDLGFEVEGELLSSVGWTTSFRWPAARSSLSTSKSTLEKWKESEAAELWRSIVDNDGLTVVAEVEGIAPGVTGTRDLMRAIRQRVLGGWGQSREVLIVDRGSLPMTSSGRLSGLP